MNQFMQFWIFGGLIYLRNRFTEMDDIQLQLDINKKLRRSLIHTTEGHSMYRHICIYIIYFIGQHAEHNSERCSFLTYTDIAKLLYE